MPGVLESDIPDSTSSMTKNEREMTTDIVMVTSENDYPRHVVLDVVTKLNDSSSDLNQEEEDSELEDINSCCSMGENDCSTNHQAANRALDSVATQQRRLAAHGATTSHHVRSFSSSDEEICELLGDSLKSRRGSAAYLPRLVGWENTAFCPIEVEESSSVEDGRNYGDLTSSGLGRTTRRCRPPGRCHVNKTAVIQRPSLDFDKMQVSWNSNETSLDFS